MSKQTTANAVAACEKVLSDLQAKRAAVVARADDLAAERAAIAYATHAVGDGKSRARLDAIHIESVTVTGELASLDCAVAEADKRLSAAREREARKADKAAAQELLAELARFRDIATQLDAALASVSASGAALSECLGKIHQFGSPFPSNAQLHSLGHRALLTAISTMPWRKEFEAVPPLSRRSFSSLIATWCSTIEGTIAQKTEAADAA